MVDERTVNYIRGAISKGTSEKEIEVNLKNNGWTADDIQDAMQEAHKEAPVKPAGAIGDLYASSKSKEDVTRRVTKTIPVKEMILGFLAVIIVTSIFSYVVLFKDKPDSQNYVSLEQQTSSLGKHFCNKYCERGECTLFNNPQFASEDYKDKSCTEIGISCYKCTS